MWRHRVVEFLSHHGRVVSGGYTRELGSQKQPGSNGLRKEPRKETTKKEEPGWSEEERKGTVKGHESS